jgi:uncharacterized protein (TIGR02145 family)
MKKVLFFTILLNSFFAISQVTDLNGRTYKVTSIGNQTWMAENLEVVLFRNGDEIPYAETSEEWFAASKKKKPAWCYYNNDPLNKNKFGVLYNWYAINDPRGIAPIGYHIPNDEEWNTLVSFLNSPMEGSQNLEVGQWITYKAKVINEDGDTIISNKKKDWQTKQITSIKEGIPYILKSDGTKEVSIQLLRIVESGPDMDNTTPWQTKGKITDENGFAALMGGYRKKGDYAAYFADLNFNGFWWTSKESNESSAMSIIVNKKYGQISVESKNKTDGYSVRCIKD